MTNYKTLLASIAATAIMIGPSFSQSLQQRYEEQASREPNCGTWLRDIGQNGQPSVYMQSYIMGWTDGLEEYEISTGGNVHGWNVEQKNEWITRYCTDALNIRKINPNIFIIANNLFEAEGGRLYSRQNLRR